MKNLARNSFLSFAASALLVTSGCSILLPKQVEFFQRKVKPVPEYSDASEETQRQAAERIYSQTRDAAEAAIRENAGTNITDPLTDAENVANGLSISLGPPARPYGGSSYDLSAKLRHNRAALDEAIQDYANKVDKDVGKKIEGTGLVKMSYFTMLAGVIAVPLLLWFALRVYGIFNPVVGGVTSVIGRVSGAVLHKGFTQIVAGGERFKDMLEKSNLDEKTAEYVKTLFRAAHEQSADSDVKAIVKGITQYPDSSLPEEPPK